MAASNDPSPGGEQYSHGYGVAADYMANRPPAPNIEFLLPYLKQGMTILDAGCGPGSNAIAFAEILESGKVTGIDVEASQIERARSQANEQGLTNAHFEVSSIYELPFLDETFDAAFAHTVLQHLSDPVAAIKEIRRVLRPGGVIGVREEDDASLIMWPEVPHLVEALELYRKYWRHNGGNPNFARRHREALRLGGFTDIQAGASVMYRGVAEETKTVGKLRADYWIDPTYVDTAISQGWADRDALEKMSAAFLEWGNHPDAFSAIIWCHAVGFKPA